MEIKKYSFSPLATKHSDPPEPQEKDAKLTPLVVQGYIHQFEKVRYLKTIEWPYYL